MLIWQRKNGGRDLYLDDSCELPVEEFKTCCNKFFSAGDKTKGNVYEKLQEALNEFPQRRVLTCDERDLRGGYIGLYRRCVTPHGTFKQTWPEAKELWEFLFGPLPAEILAESHKGVPLVNSRVWNRWVETVTQDMETIIGEEEEMFSCEEKYLEGGVKYRQHRRRERNAKLVASKKASVDPLVCEVCGFDFEKQYGDLGKGFAECHHIVPLELADSVIETKLSDLAILCSNCHRMIHRNGICSLDELKQRIARPWSLS